LADPSCGFDSGFREPDTVVSTPLFGLGLSFPVTGLLGEVGEPNFGLLLSVDDGGLATGALGLETGGAGLETGGGFGAVGLDGEPNLGLPPPPLEGERELPPVPGFA